MASVSSLTDALTELARAFTDDSKVTGGRNLVGLENFATFRVDYDASEPH